MFSFGELFRRKFYRLCTVFSSGVGSASLAIGAISLSDSASSLPVEVTVMICVVASLAGVLCALAYFAAGNDTSGDYQKIICIDPITGILSRDGLEPELRKLAATIDEKLKINRLFLISMDFDELRGINDIYGNETGNAVLRVIAQRLKLLIGDAGSLARTNGSEFVVVLKSGSDERELRAAVLALIETMSQPVRIGAISYPVYANGGVVEVHRNYIQIEKLLRRAGLARSHAKASGRGSYAIYHPEMSHQASYRQWVQTELTFAMERKEFALHYQPQFDVRKNRIVGYEALIRWMHREKGAISPAEFISVAENCGFIKQLGTWVLRRACIDALKLPNDCKMSINVSTPQLEEADFMNTLKAILSETGVDPKRIELEVTESLLIRDHINMRRLLRSIRDLGISIAIDDFGTGYSNLINLSELEFDKIKIDKSFVDRLAVSKNSSAMIATIVSLAHSMDAAVVAEGIETETQSILLQAAGCNVMQGYYYGRPAPLTATTSADKELAA